MPHLGGPTTQSGILFQNSVASLFLGDLLDAAASGSQQVVAVRVEAPAWVDDTVVSYADSHLVYIQAKESLRVAFSRVGARAADEESEGDLEEEEAQAPRAGAARSPQKTPWEKLWLDFEAQFLSAGFGRGRDRLMLFCGSLSESVRNLKALCEWAKSLSEK